MQKRNGGKIRMIKVVEENNQKDFEEKSNALIRQGYKLSSSAVGYVPAPYDCNYFMAIFYI
jgi:hypothetical protein